MMAERIDDEGGETDEAAAMTDVGGDDGDLHGGAFI
jgi:hypothetical protein